MLTRPTAEKLETKVGQWIFFVLNENMVSQKYVYWQLHQHDNYHINLKGYLHDYILDIYQTKTGVNFNEIKIKK